MLAGWLMAAAKRRGGGSITVIDEQTASNAANLAVTFSATPSNGERIVFVYTSRGTITPPAGFTQVVLGSDGTQQVLITSRVASSEASATYTFTAANSSSGLYGVRLSACSVGNSGTNTGASATSLAASSASIVVRANAFAVCGFALSGLHSAVSVNNSFSLAVTNTTARSHIGKRAYMTGGATENATLSWTTARNAAGALAEFYP